MHTIAGALLILSACLPASALAQRLTEGQAEITVERVEVPLDEASFERGVFIRAGGAITVPVTGPLAEIGNMGGSVRVGAGYYITQNIALLAELDAGHLPRGADEDVGYGIVGAGVGVRASMPFMQLLHLFGEATARLAMIGSEPGTVLQLLEPSEILGASVAFGLELDLLDGVSAEGGLRADYLLTADHFTTSTEPQERGNTLTVSPFASLSYFF